LRGKNSFIFLSGLTSELYKWFLSDLHALGLTIHICIVINQCSKMRILSGLLIDEKGLL